MVDYNPILATETDPDAPLRTSLFKRLEANPRAIAEGAAGAPKVNGIALAGVFLAALSGPTIGVVGIARAGRFAVDCYVAHNGFSGGARSLRARYTADNGSTWSAWQTVLSVAAPGASNGGSFNFTFSVDVTDGAFAAAGIGVHLGAYIPLVEAGTHTIPANCNGMQLGWSDSMLFSAAFYCLGGAA